jgi:hypothetical protein
VALTLHGPPRPLVPGEALVSQQGKLLVPLVVDGKLHIVVVRTASTTATRSKWCRG